MWLFAAGLLSMSGLLAASESPAVREIAGMRVFGEPLVVAADALVSAEECEALVKALTAFRERKDRDDASALEGFLAAYPASPWRVALLTNLGSFYYHQGYFSKAIDAWERAWKAGKVQTDNRVCLLVDRAVGELAKMHARIGNFERLDELFKELGSRQVSGTATEYLQGAHEGVWLMRNKPEDAFRCGPMALGRVVAELDGKPIVDPRVSDFKSTQKGTSLKQVFDYSKKLGVKLQMAKRSAGATLITPALIHWKVGHFAAVAGKREGLYLIQDPTFGEDLLVSRSALDAEASGYFLVPQGKLPAGWKAVSAKEAEQIWGKGNTSTVDQDETKKCSEQTGGCSDCGGTRMAQYSVHALLVSLHIYDAPFGYESAFGPEVEFEVVYNQREVGQPANFSYFNLGPKWTTNWTSFVTDDPTVVPAQVSLSERFGGTSKFNFPPSTAQDRDSLPNPDDGSILQRKSTGLYERRFSDGSKMFYGQPNATTGPGRRVFLTKVIDPAGNEVRLTYDSSFRLTAITDAAGKVTNLEYTLAGDPLKITKVTEVVQAPAVGRSASFEYNAQGRLRKITDIAGITSEFTYQGDFIDALTTPYGTTRFAYMDSSNGASGQTRRLTITDQLGGREKVEYRHDAPGTADKAPANQVPSAPGLTVTNSWNNYRNTFYWSKKAMQVAPEDYTQAELLHWLHLGSDSSKASGTLESRKAPLENRVWFKYLNQAGTASTGTNNWPTQIARVLDDGTTQLYQREYNSIGQITKRIDPLGRETVFEYSSNGDLLRAKQKNGAAYDILLELGGYNAQRMPGTITDAAGKTTSLAYNARGQVTSVTNAKNETYTLLYETNPTAHGYGRPTRILGPGSVTLRSLTYDAYGRIKSTKDSEDYTLSYDYDALDRITEVAHPDGSYEEHIYNCLDLEWSRDRLGRWSRVFTDALRRPIALIDPAGKITNLDWCTCGALNALSDPAGNRTSFAYDVQSRLTSKTYSDNTVLQFIYENGSSRLKERVDAKGQRTLYSYFKDNALQQISYSGGVATPAVNLAYEAAYRRLASRTDGSGATSFTYRPALQLGAGQMATVDGPLANDTISYSYDELGRQLSSAVNSVAESRTFDALGRIATVTNSLGAFTNTYINATDRLSQTTLPNGLNAVFSYFDNVGDQRLKEIKHLAGTTEISKSNYTYNAVGNITSWTRARSGAPDPTRFDLGYDPVDQLVSATLKNVTTGAALQKLDYQYDKAGNRTSAQADNSVVGAGYNNLNQMISRGSGGSMIFEGTLSELASVTVGGNPAPVDASKNFRGAVTVASGSNTIPITATDASGNSTTKNAVINIPADVSQASLTYDLNGNLTSDGSKTYTWDAANRLVKIVGGALQTDIVYDGLSRRVRMTDRNNGAIVRDVAYVWRGGRIVEERTGDGATVTKRFFAQGVQAGTQSFFYTHDHLGSVREMIDASGAVRARYDYDLYGARTKVSGTVDADVGFTGHFHHGPSGQILSWFRAYDPGQGRWLSRDPIAENGGLNLYAYVANNPTNYIDPDGRKRSLRQMAAIVAHVLDALARTLSGDPNILDNRPIKSPYSDKAKRDEEEDHQKNTNPNKGKKKGAGPKCLVTPLWFIWDADETMEFLLDYDIDKGLDENIRDMYGPEAYDVNPLGLPQPITLDHIPTA